MAGRKDRNDRRKRTAGADGDRFRHCFWLYGMGTQKKQRGMETGTEDCTRPYMRTMRKHLKYGMKHPISGSEQD